MLFETKTFTHDTFEAISVDSILNLFFWNSQTKTGAV